MDQEEEKRDRMRLIGTFMTLPFVLAVPPIIGLYIGSKLDKWWDTAPWMMYFFTALGIVAGIREFYRIVKKYGKKEF